MMQTTGGFIRDAVAAAVGVVSCAAVARADLERRRLSRNRRLSALALLDVAAVAAAMAILVICLALFLVYGRIADVCTAVAFGIAFPWLWDEGQRSIQWQRPPGIVAGEFLIIAGIIGLAVGFLRPSLPQFLGLTLTQSAALAAIVAGVVLLSIIVPRHLRAREEHRIIDDVSVAGESVQPEYAPATPECPHPELWKMYDSMTAEVEVLDFLKQLVITLKPNLVIETGTFTGVSTLAIAQGLQQNGFGRVITVEFDPKVFAKAKERFNASGLGAWIDARNHSSLELQVDGAIDLLFSDSDLNLREQEVRHFLPQISPNGLVAIHDASSHQSVVREAALRLEAEGLLSVVLLPTPRGLVVAQKRAERS